MDVREWIMLGVLVVVAIVGTSGLASYLWPKPRRRPNPTRAIRTPDGLAEHLETLMEADGDATWLEDRVQIYRDHPSHGRPPPDDRSSEPLPTAAVPTSGRSHPTVWGAPPAVVGALVGLWLILKAAALGQRWARQPEFPLGRGYRLLALGSVAAWLVLPACFRAIAGSRQPDVARSNDAFLVGSLLIGLAASWWLVETLRRLATGRAKAVVFFFLLLPWAQILGGVGLLAVEWMDDRAVLVLGPILFAVAAAPGVLVPLLIALEASRRRPARPR